MSLWNNLLLGDEVTQRMIHVLFIRTCPAASQRQMLYNENCTWCICVFANGKSCFQLGEVLPILLPYISFCVTHSRSLLCYSPVHTAGDTCPESGFPAVLFIGICIWTLRMSFPWRHESCLSPSLPFPSVSSPPLPHPSSPLLSSVSFSQSLSLE